MMVQPRVGDLSSFSTEPSAVRAAKFQKSRVRNEPPETLRSKLTMMLFSRISDVPDGGTGISADPSASMSHQTVVPSCS